MNCKQINTKLSAYLDGELDGTEMLLVRSHLTDCGDCRTELEMLRRVKQMLGELAMPEVPTHLESRLMESVFASDKKPKISAASPWKLVVASGLATAAAVLALLQFFAVPPQGEPSIVQRDVSGAIARDQAIQAGPDPLSGGTPVILVNAR